MQTDEPKLSDSAGPEEALRSLGKKDPSHFGVLFAATLDQVLNFASVPGVVHLYETGKDEFKTEEDVEMFVTRSADVLTGFHQKKGVRTPVMYVIRTFLGGRSKDHIRVIGKR